MHHALERAKDGENTIVHSVLDRRDLLYSAFLPIRLSCWQGFRTAAAVRQSEGTRRRGTRILLCATLAQPPRRQRASKWLRETLCSMARQYTNTSPPAIPIEDERPASASLVLLFSIQTPRVPVGGSRNACSYRTVCRLQEVADVEIRQVKF